MTFLGGSGSVFGAGSGSRVLLVGSAFGAGSGSRVLLIGSAFGGGGVSSSDDEDEEEEEPLAFRLSSFAAGTGLIPLLGAGALAGGRVLAGDTTLDCAAALTGISSSELDVSELDETFFRGFATLLLDLAILES